MAMTMVGTQTPQKLFGDIPAENANIPGMVTPNITAAMPSMVDWADIINAQNAQKALSQASWARANAQRAQQQQQSAPQPHYLPSSSETGSGMGSQYKQQQGGSVLWAPRGMNQSQLGTWSDQQQKKAMAENRTPPIILQAKTDQPYSPGEQGGGVSQNEIGKTLFGPGLSTPMGGMNPAVWAKMWGGSSGGGGGDGGGYSGDPFSKQSLRERTNPSNSGPQYQYDVLYRG
jgi:hypothetical protein